MAKMFASKAEEEQRAKAEKAEAELRKALVEVETAEMIQRYTATCIARDKNPLSSNN